MTETSTFPAEPHRSILFNTYQRARLLLTVASVLALLLFWYAGHLFHIPAHHGFEASLLVDGSPALNFVVTAICLVLSLVLGTLVAGSVRYDAGLCTACVGLLALSLRGGPARYVFLDASSPAIYLTLLVELCLLFALVGAASFLQTFLHSLGLLKEDVFRDGLADTEDPLSDKLQALAVQIVTMAVLVYFLAATGQKKQVLAAIAVGSFLGTTLAHHLFPVRPSFWFWIAPLFVGAIGYVWAFANPGPDLIIGMPANNLARGLPLDYASVGPAAAIIAYWFGRRRKREEQIQLNPHEEPRGLPPHAPIALPPRPQRFDADRD